jgi:hypothetical protein
MSPETRSTRCFGHSLQVQRRARSARCSSRPSGCCPLLLALGHGSSSWRTVAARQLTAPSLHKGHRAVSSPRIGSSQPAVKSSNGMRPSRAAPPRVEPSLPIWLPSTWSATSWTFQPVLAVGATQPNSSSERRNVRRSASEGRLAADPRRHPSFLPSADCSWAIGASFCQRTAASEFDRTCMTHANGHSHCRSSGSSGQLDCPTSIRV